MSNKQSPSIEEEYAEFDQALEKVEQLLTDIKKRYDQIKFDRLRQIELGSRLEDIYQELKENRHRELRQELKEIEKELELIELNLESSLFTLGSLKEPFWQAIRFGGLGIVIGWLLKSCVS